MREFVLKITKDGQTTYTCVIDCEIDNTVTAGLIARGYDVEIVKEIY